MRYATRFRGRPGARMVASCHRVALSWLRLPCVPLCIARVKRRLHVGRQVREHTRSPLARNRPRIVRVTCFRVVRRRRSRVLFALDMRKHCGNHRFAPLFIGFDSRRLHPTKKPRSRLFCFAGSSPFGSIPGASTNVSSTCTSLGRFPDETPETDNAKKPHPRFFCFCAFRKRRVRPHKTP